MTVVVQVPSQHLWNEPESFIRIQPDWLDQNHRYNIYLSFRQSDGGDRDLEEVAPQYAGKVGVSTAGESPVHLVMECVLP